MKARVIILTAVLAAVLLVPASLPAEVRVNHGDDDDLFRDDNVSVEFEDHIIVFTHNESDETVEITQRGELAVDGRDVSLNRGERALVADYHETFDRIVEEAKAIGLQGAKMGVKGAALGVKAAVGVLRLLSPNYDSDDLEDDLAEEEEELDRASSKLEARAERLEKQVDELKLLHEDMRERIDELDELGWF